MKRAAKKCEAQTMIFKLGENEIEIRVLQASISGRFVLEARANTGYLKIQPYTANRITVEVVKW